MFVCVCMDVYLNIFVPVVYFVRPIVNLVFQCDCHIPTEAQSSSSRRDELFNGIFAYLTPALLEQIRTYLGKAQLSAYNVSTDMQKVVTFITKLKLGHTSSTWPTVSLHQVQMQIQFSASCDLWKSIFHLMLCGNRNNMVINKFAASCKLCWNLWDEKRLYLEVKLGLSCLCYHLFASSKFRIYANESVKVDSLPWVEHLCVFQPTRNRR